MKPATARSLALLASMIAGTALLECGLRWHAFGRLTPLSGEHVLRTPHPTRGWALKPGGVAHQRSPDFDVVVEINEAGFRDLPHDRSEAGDAIRIVVLGDSFMEAYQVDLEVSLPRQLAARWNDPDGSARAEVSNLGVGGYGTAQQLRVFEELGIAYRPHWVVLAFYTGNDVENNSRALQARIFGSDDPKVWGRPYARVTPGGLVWSEPDFARMQAAARARAEARRDPLRRLVRQLTPSVAANRIQQVLARWLPAARQPHPHFAAPFLAGPRDPEQEAAWQTTLALIRELHLRTRAAGARLMLLVVPSRIQVEEGFRDRVRALHPGTALDTERISRELAAFAAREGIAFFDPTPQLVESTRAGAPVFHQVDDNHWNARGHAIAAEGLAAALVREGLVRKGPVRQQQGQGPVERPVD